jgi:VWFA-related protein
MTRGLLALGVVAALAAAQQPIFHSGADAVQVDVLATDGHRPIGGLTAADFELRDSGVVQTIDALQIADVPFSMMLALDTSASMKGASLRQLQDGARAAIDALKPNDRATLMTFNTAVGRALPWDTDRAALRDAVDHIEAGGMTGLFDAALAAIVQRDPEPGRRNLLILFTDGVDTSSWLPDFASLDLASRSDIVIYGVTTDADLRFHSASLAWRSGIRLADSQPVFSTAPFLREISERTGGENDYTTGTDLRKVFARIVDDFHTRYVLTYRPAGVPAEGWHPLDVRLKARSGHVTARRGYDR